MGRYMKLVIFLALFLTHAMAGWLVRPIAAGSLYLPAMAAHRLGLPVLGSGAGGWPSPTLLGWCVVIGAWFAVYWGLAALLTKLLMKRSRSPCTH